LRSSGRSDYPGSDSIMENDVDVSETGSSLGARGIIELPINKIVE